MADVAPVPPPDASALVRRYRNLVGVPSFRFDPAFAQAVVRAMDEHAPDVVALELPEPLAESLAWAARCWPEPVGCVLPEAGLLYPFVPGDAMLEAYRIAAMRGTPVALIDLPTRLRPVAPSLPFPAAGLLRRAGRRHAEVVDAMVRSAGAPARADRAREAHMAGWLAQAMQDGSTVLWVGGMARWARLVDRIEAGDFGGPSVRLVEPGAMRRVRLGPSALVEATGRVPWAVQRYAAAPEAYDEAELLRVLAGEALGEQAAASEAPGQRAFNWMEPDAVEPDAVEPGAVEPGAVEPGAVEPEDRSPADLIRFLIYARNLAATRAVAEAPDVATLLGAAVATMGRRYAGRLLALAMAQPDPPPGSPAAEAPRADYVVGEHVKGYQVDGRWLLRRKATESDRRRWRFVAYRAGELPWWLGGAAYRDLPPSTPDEPAAWCEYPPEQEAYERFVRQILLRASHPEPGAGASMPFRSGLRDGIDVRETLRHWGDGEVYVREERLEHTWITNAVIDWSSDREGTPVHRGDSHVPGGYSAGWSDPSLTTFGSATRETRQPAVIQDDPEVTLRTRELSLVTLDVPTLVRGGGRPSFYDLVISPLVDLPWADDDLYGWLAIMFRFCAGKPFAYFSRYRPGPRIHALAAEHGVRLVHRPLSSVPDALIARQLRWRFLWLTEAQWREMTRRCEVAREGWGVAWAR